MKNFDIFKEKGYHAAEKLLDLKTRPPVIYTNGDEVAGGIFKYALSRNYTIPDDLAILGQENQPIGTGLDISTVDHQLIKVGETAFDLAIAKSREKVKIPYVLIQRSSV
ncbi:substrate-binding domain-containing protein [Brevibacillus laterosporus]|uniref:Substrate-binding domain-containing protein n=1 Tax=Brevibacillus halotolerans TaxID=1507437 RepID=A0ABT4HV16_9BACL|nr:MULTISPECIES: substrate-binding domain-containing protein [Brevibacillus]MCR8984830.1 substrate-binding domain-containing protein [Brevibacillus laterosporus]MCZ0830557.1 substrate-binding domain-containing protein [Brevibacillus halotolerans]